MAKSAVRVAVVSVLAMVLLGEGAPGAADSIPSNMAGQHSSSIVLTANGMTLLAANPDSNSVSVVDLVSEEVTEIGVGLDPRAVAVDDLNNRAFVASRGSHSVTAIDIAERRAIARADVGIQPYGLVASPDGERLYVAEQGEDLVRVLDAATLATLERWETLDRPSGLAIDEAGRFLYVTHLLDPRVRRFSLHPFRVRLPLLARGLGTSSLTPGLRSNVSQDYIDITMWTDSNLVQSVVIAPDGARAYVPHTRSNDRNSALTFDTTVFPMVSVLDLSVPRHLVGAQIDLATADPPGVGLPFDAAVSPDGGVLWVVNAASNDISVIELGRNRLVAHVEVGDNPRGIALARDGRWAYVNDALSGTISVIDARSYEVIDEIVLTQIPLPPALLNGKRLFYSSDDPRLSQAQWISCNTCHFDGEQDGRTWRFGFSGPRNTTSLLGMIQTYPLRWSGEWNESADSEFAVRMEGFGAGLAPSPMYCADSPPDCVDQPPNQGRSYDLDCLALYIDSLAIPMSPGHARGEPLSQQEARGKAIFGDAALGCVSCHPAPLYTDLLSHDVGTAGAEERIGPAYDTPSLRGVYGSAPFFHDGSAATLRDALTRPTSGGEHDVTGLLTQEQIDDLFAFLEALPYE